MSFLENLATDDTIKGESDNLGGFNPLDTDIYDCTIDLAFFTVSAGGATAVNLHLMTEDGQQMRQQLWVTSRTSKGGKHFYTNKQGQKLYLPGFNQANAVCLLTTGKEISKAEVEPKVINLFDPSEMKEVPTKVQMLVGLLGKKITAGIIKQIVDKKTKDPKSGEYVPTGQTRTENELDKVFSAKDGRTVTEIRAKEAKASFKDKWLTKWKGQVKDKSTKMDGINNGAPLMPSPTGSAAPQESLFA